MLNSRNKKLAILTAVVISILILGLFRQISFSYAQGDEKSHEIPLNSDVGDESEITGRNENITQISIDLGDRIYNITGIQINFTNIKMERQIKIIEDENFGYNVVYNNTDSPPYTKYRTGLGVQIDPQVDAMLYGVYIFGFKESTTTENIAFQLRGYESDVPNNVLHRNQTLNISTERTWYYQEFEEPFKLLETNDYYLVMNGSNLPSDGLNQYYWSINNLFPKYELFSAVYDDKNPPNAWKAEESTSFLYKLDQKTNETFNPEDIEMEAVINGEFHAVKTGTLPGTGNLTLPDISFFPDTQIFNIPITNNDSITLNYTIDYWINLMIATAPTIPGGGAGNGGGGGTTTITGLDPMLVTIISIIIIASVVGALVSYQTLKSVKKKRDLELQKLQNKFIDILSLNYLLVVDKKTGLNVYEQFFAGKKIDASLISGFFEAIRNFGIELTGTYTQSQSVKLEYQESKIIMSEFRNFRLIFVMTENPSEDFLTTITNFSYDIDEKFGEFLQDFKGDTTKFRDIRKLVEKNFFVSFISPLMVRDVSDMKLKDAEIAMINKAKAIMKQNNLNYFFTSFLLPEQTYDPKKTRTIFNLIDKKIFIPTKLT